MNDFHEKHKNKVAMVCMIILITLVFLFLRNVDSPTNVFNVDVEWSSVARIGSNLNARMLLHTFDGHSGTRWTTYRPPRAGDYIEIEFSEDVNYTLVALDPGINRSDFPRALSVYVSSNGRRWNQVPHTMRGNYTVLFESEPYRFLRIEHGVSPQCDGSWWTVVNLRLEYAETDEWIEWIASSNVSAYALYRIADYNPGTRWTTNRAPSAGDYIMFEFYEAVSHTLLALSPGVSVNDFARVFTIYTSLDGQQWNQIPHTMRNNYTAIFESEPYRFLRVVHGENPLCDGSWWTVVHARFGRA